MDKLGCHGKRCPDQSSAPKTLSLGENIANNGPVDSEIIVLQTIMKIEH